MSPVPNPVLPAGAVATLDRLLAGQRAAVCVVSRPTGARSVGGAPETIYTEVAQAPCTVVAAGATERLIGGRLAPAAEFELRFARDVDVRSDDRVTVNGLTLEVIYAPTAASFGLQLAVRAQATT